MRPRDQLLANLEAIYRRSYDAAKAEGLERRMEELDSAYQRDQLMMEVFLDVRDLLSAPPATSGGGSALQQIDALHRLTKLR